MDVYIYQPGMHSPERATEHARRIEDLGYDGIAMPDHLFVPSFATGEPTPYAHGPSILAACAAVTSRVRLMTLMASNLTRSPVELVQIVSTIDRLSGGRAEFGVGAGWFRAEYEAMGLEFPQGRERIERLREAVQIARQFFGTGAVNFDGVHYTVSVPVGGLLPVDSAPPITVGAAGPNAIRAAAGVADRVDFQPDALQGGVVDLARYNSFGVEQLRAGVDAVRRVADEIGRELPLSQSPFVLVTENAADGAEQRREMADSLGLERSVMDRSLGTIVGTAAEVADRLASSAEAGCDRVHLQALHPEVAERLAPALPALKAL